MEDEHTDLKGLAATRTRVATLLTAAMVGIYFGFIALIAFNKPLLATRIASGLSFGILLGALVIVLAWLLTWFYVRWANAWYDPRLELLRRGESVRSEK